ncbi:MAG: peroxiredoxin-like family protein [Thermoleophilaceae bacterium]
MTRAKPREQAPPLQVDTLNEGRWDLADSHPQRFSLVVFYRGLHCPVCRGYLRELDRNVEALGERGVEVIAISGDTPDRAEEACREWKLERLNVGHGQSVEAMRKWGLFVSRGIKDDEPEQFGEPGLFLVEADGSLFYEAINSMPFGRPPIAEILDGIDFVTDNDYPARGEA